jgi:hypothetical protein
MTLDMLEGSGSETERGGERAARRRGESRWKKAFHVELPSGKTVT